MRKCRLKSCRKRIPSLKESDAHQKRGFCTHQCVFQYWKGNQAEQAEKQRIALGSHRNAPKTRKPDPVGRAEKAEKRARNRQNKAKQEHLTQKRVNMLARVLGQGELCISCGETDQCEAGHFRSVAAMPALRFDLRNIFPQCRPCNMAGTRTYKRGKKPEVVRAEYERRLRLKMGDEYVDWLKRNHREKHYSCDDLREMRRAVNAEIKRIEKGTGPSRDWRRLDNTDEDFWRNQG